MQRVSFTSVGINPKSANRFICLTLAKTKTTNRGARGPTYSRPRSTFRRRTTRACMRRTAETVCTTDHTLAPRRPSARTRPASIARCPSTPTESTTTSTCPHSKTSTPTISTRRQNPSTHTRRCAAWVRPTHTRIRTHSRPNIGVRDTWSQTSSAARSTTSRGCEQHHVILTRKLGCLPRLYGNSSSMRFAMGTGSPTVYPYSSLTRSRNSSMASASSSS